MNFLNAYLKHDSGAEAFLKRTPLRNGVPQHLLATIFASHRSLRRFQRNRRHLQSSGIRDHRLRPRADVGCTCFVSELGVDRARIAIKGESAGSGHAAALAIIARDRGEIPLCFQVLVYPMLDDRTGSSVSVPPYLGRYVWTPESNRFGWTSLLGVPAGSAVVPPNSVPARVDNLAGLPPAWIGVGSIDLFARGDLEYARRLLLAGVSTEVNLVPGAFHAFDRGVPQAPLSLAFNQSWNAALTRAFARTI